MNACGDCSDDTKAHKLEKFLFLPGKIRVNQPFYHANFLFRPREFVRYYTADGV